MTTLLISATLKTSLVFALAAMLARAAGSKSASQRHHIWALAILGALLLPLAEATVPGWHWNVLTNAALTPSTGLANRIPVTSITVVAHAPGIDWSAWLLAIWVTGFALMLLRPFAGSIRLAWTAAHASPLQQHDFQSTLRRCMHSIGIGREVRILISPDPKTMPCTWGCLRARILLPSSCLEWPEPRREMVLAHELAHIRRLDWPLRLFAELARALYWFHPMAWLAVAKLHEESERACDDAVLASGQDPARYASELLGLVRSARTQQNTQYTWSPALAVARHSNLERRFTAMLDISINRRHLTRKAATLTTAAALLLLLPLAAVRSTAQGTEADQFNGTVLDPGGKAVVNATVALTNVDTRTVEMTTSDAVGLFHFHALAAGEYNLRVMKEGYELFTKPGLKLETRGNAAELVTLQAGSLAAPAKWTGEKMIRIGGNVAAASLVAKVAPVYPQAARAAGIQGAVTLEAVIGKDGVPVSLRIVNPEVDPALAAAAVEAVRQWRYKPTLLNGEPVQVLTNVVVNFTLLP